ncbi:MAG TPA: hypothetical protein PKH09_01260, partial [Parvularculaceae bacterium]|nr:hypothetical protein [Parvularculaceae bacterium]
YSDAPDWDSFWMMRLFDAAARKSAIRIRDFSTLMAPLAPEKKAQLLSQADRQAPRRHRAGEDALHLVAVFRLSKDL